MTNIGKKLFTYEVTLHSGTKIRKNVYSDGASTLPATVYVNRYGKWVTVIFTDGKPRDLGGTDFTAVRLERRLKRP